MLKWKNIVFSHQVHGVTAGNPQPPGRCPSSDLRALFWEDWTQLSRQWKLPLSVSGCTKRERKKQLPVCAKKSHETEEPCHLTAFFIHAQLASSASSHFPASLAEMTESLYHFAMCPRSTEQAGSEATIKSRQICCLVKSTLELYSAFKINNMQPADFCC